MPLTQLRQKNNFTFIKSLFEKNHIVIVFEDTDYSKTMTRATKITYLATVSAFSHSHCHIAGG